MVRLIALSTVMAVALWALLAAAPSHARADASSGREPAWGRTGGSGFVLRKKKHPPASQQANDQKPKDNKPPKTNSGNGKGVAAFAQLAVTRAVRRLKIAQDLADIAQHELDQVVDDIEQDQPSDSPFTQAKDRFEAARTAHDDTIEQARNSTPYKQAIDQISSSAEDRVKQVSDLHDKLVNNDPKVLETAVELKAARKDYDSQLDAILHPDDNWVAASDKLKAARKTVADAEIALHSAELDRLAVAGPIPGLATSNLQVLDPAAQQKANAKTDVQEQATLKKLEAKEGKKK